METFESYEDVGTPDNVVINGNATFDDMEVLESVSNEADEGGQDGGKAEDNSGKETSEGKDEEKKAEVKKEDKEKEKFDAERGDVDKKDSKDGDGEKKEGEDEGKDDDKKEEEKTEGKRGRAKTVKAEVNGEELEISKDAKIPVKVNGKMENFTLQELINNQSSKVSINEELSKIKVEKDDIKREREQFSAERDTVVSHMNTLLNKVDSENPLEAFEYLLDLAGKNPYTYTDKVFRHFYDDFEKINDMDETEQKAYFLEKENAYLKRSTESRESRIQEESFKQATFKEIDQLRTAHGLTEDDFVKAGDDLVKLGHDLSDISPEHIIQHHQKMVVIDKAEKLINQVDSELAEDDDVVVKYAEFLYRNPDVSDDYIISKLKAEYGVKSGPVKTELDQLNEKIGTDKTPKRQEAQDDGRIETFDDFDDYGYN